MKGWNPTTHDEKSTQTKTKQNEGKEHKMEQKIANEESKSEESNQINRLKNKSTWWLKIINMVKISGVWCIICPDVGYTKENEG